jgi:hypothetical protein
VKLQFFNEVPLRLHILDDAGSGGPINGPPILFISASKAESLSFK